MKGAAPYDETAERAVVGAILLDGNTVLEKLNEAGVDSSWFYVPATRTIYEVAMRLSAAGKVADIVTIGNSLNGQKEAIGGEVFLQQCCDDCVTTAHVSHYLDILKAQKKRRAILQITQAAIAATQDPANDADEVIAHTMESLFAATGMRTGPTTNVEAINKKIEEVENTRQGKYPGLPFFLPSINKLLGHMRLGKCYYCGGTPGRGKSTFLANQLNYLARIAKIPCAVNSVEMDHDEFISRIVADVADISLFALETNMPEDTRPGEKSRLEKFADGAAQFVDAETGENKIPLYINDSHMDVDQFCIWARMMVKRHGVQFIAVDYLQILKESAMEKRSERETLVYTVNTLRAIAKELHIVLLVLSQLATPSAASAKHGEEPKERKPQAGDLFGSRSMQQAAYGIFMLYEHEGDFWCDVQKHRGGPTGARKVIFIRSRQRFVDADSEEARRYVDLISRNGQQT
jgi:replicative DNA helicase